jgi:rhodanese-related sulfurtransferase
MNYDVMRPDFKQRVANLDPAKTYFVYCQSGRRSAKACRIMTELGFQKVVNLKGGIVAYEGKTV